MTKTCAKCKDHKHVDEYNKRQNGDPLAYCRKCQNEYDRERKYGKLANSDTLFILPNDKIHFIKIGDRVYKIESPTLTEVHPASMINGFPNFRVIYNDTSPNRYDIVDPYKNIILPRIVKN